MNRFDEMRAFAHVVETGSITGAADRLNLAKSAVSRRLAQLESRLGVQLLSRSTRRLNITETGRAFYQRCAGILSDVEEAEAAVSIAHAALNGKLRVAAPLSFGIDHLGPAIDEFSARHAGLRFDVDFNDRRVDLLEEGFDLCIRIGELEDSALMARRLAPVRHVVCASPDFLEKHGTPTTPADLDSGQLLRYTNISSTVWGFQDPSGNPGGLRVRARLEANNGEFLRDMAIAGHGVVRLPSFIVSKAIEDGRLRPILTEYVWGDHSVYAVYPPTRYLSHRVRAFIDFLVERFGDEPYWDECLRHAPNRVIT